MVIALHQHGEQSGDAARPVCAIDARPGALQQARQLGEHAGRIAPRRRRLAGGQPDFPQRQTEPRNAVHQQQHPLATVAEMLGDGHRGIGRLPAHQRRRVGCRHHDDRARQSGRAEFVLEKLAHLAAALADQRQHRDVAVGMARQHRQQRRLAHPRAREQAKPLALPAGRERVERAHAEIDARPQPGPRGRRRRDRAQRARPRAPRQRAALVERPSQRIDHPTDPPGIDRQGRAMGLIRSQQRPRPRPQPISRRERHGAGHATGEPDDLGCDRRPVARLQLDPVADREMARQAGDLHRQPGYPAHASLQQNRRALRDLRDRPPHIVEARRQTRTSQNSDDIMKTIPASGHTPITTSHLFRFRKKNDG